MKKILTGLILIFFGLISIMMLNIYSNSSLMKKINVSTQQITISNWNKSVNTYEENLKIEKIAKQYDVNIFRTYYVQGENKNTINVYAAVGNQKKFENLFNLNLKSKETLNDFNKNEFFTNIQSHDKNNIGSIGIMNSNNINIYNILNSELIPMTGDYFIQGGNITEIINAFKLIGLTNDYKMPTLSTSKTLNDLNMNVLIAITLVMLTIIITYLYYILYTMKEYSIKVISGYSKFDILKKYLLDIFIINSICLGIVVIITFIFVYLKYKVGLLDFMKDYIAFCLLAYVIIFIILGCLSFVIYKTELYSALKNKKPLNLIQKANFILKYFSLIVIIVVIGQLVNNLIMRENILTQLSYWKNTNEYSYTEFRYTDTTNTTKTCEFYFKLKGFFEDVNSNAILASPTYGITGDIKLNNFQNAIEDTSLQDGNTIFVNSNYLKDNKIYYINGKQVEVNDNFGDYLIVLVPESYKNNEAEIQQSYEKWYQWKRYSNKYVYEMSLGQQNVLSPSQYPPVKVEIRFIKDNQKTPLYDVKYPYSINSCIAILNGENIGADTYGSFLTRGNVYIKNSYNCNLINSAIAKNGLTSNLVATPSLYSKISTYMYKLEKQLTTDLFCISILIFIQIIIIVFCILNYMERNKMIFAVKILGGFTNLEINKIFMLKNISAYVGIYIISLILNIKMFIASSIIVLIMIIIDFILFYIIYKFKNMNILKHILNKE